MHCNVQAFSLPLCANLLLCAPLQSSMGQQPESTAAYPGTMTFGTAQRLPKPGKSGVPGPGMLLI